MSDNNSSMWCLHGLSGVGLRKQPGQPQILAKKQLPDQQHWCATTVICADYGLERHAEAVEHGRACMLVFCNPFCKASSRDCCYMSV